MSEYRTSTHALAQADTAKTPAGSLTAETESQELAASNSGRVSLVVFNDGEKVAYLAYGTTATKNKGIRLAAGESHTVSTYTGAVSAVTAEGESVLSFTEV